MKKTILLTIFFMLIIMVTATDSKIGKIELIHYKEGTTYRTYSISSAIYPLCYYIEGFWRTWDFYVINPTNPWGLSDDFILETFFISAETWDTETPQELFSDTVYYNHDVIVNDYNDGLNVVAFGDYPESNVIAYTQFWYWVDTKEIFEWDMLFNTKYRWGDATQDSNLMDFQNIATHELGHTLGMLDVYTGCNYATMYGYSFYGDIAKRILAKADIIGLQKIYGKTNRINYFGEITTSIIVS